MSLFISNKIPEGDGKKVEILPGGQVIAALGIFTIIFTVFRTPNFAYATGFGMMFGLGL